MLVEQRFKRLAGAADVEVNVRVLSSTARELRGLISQGRFREDLYHRLAVVPLEVPSLSERRDDIPMLVEHFIERLTAMSGLPRRRIALIELARTGALALLTAPGEMGADIAVGSAPVTNFSMQKKGVSE
jgi:DNA-binding NtrC family response regulator